MWAYRRQENVEIARCRSADVPDIRLHFHETAQLSFVTAGRRCLETPDGSFDIAPGQGLYIPPGVLHRFRTTTGPDGWCVNLYGDLDLGPQVRSLAGTLEHWQAACEAVPQAGVATGSDASRSFGACLTGTPGTIGDIARNLGLSREYFTRRFVKTAGIPPHTYRLLARLNHARRALRAGGDPAGVAAELGFVDQSHLGRHFRRTFGTTPGAYRKSRS